MAQPSRPVDGRPDPDALLAAFRRETAGRLKVFLGAAPGVGKTYAMLGAARGEKAGGRDVVAGLIETHGRRETEQDFEELLDWLRVAQLDRVGCFEYSPVEGAAANLLSQTPVPPELKAERRARFMGRRSGRLCPAEAVELQAGARGEPEPSSTRSRGSPPRGCAW